MSASRRHFRLQRPIQGIIGAAPANGQTGPGESCYTRFASNNAPSTQAAFNGDPNGSTPNLVCAGGYTAQHDDRFWIFTEQLSGTNYGQGIRSIVCCKSLP